MSLLARREHSCQELRQKLGQRLAADAALIAAEVARLRDEGLQSDSRLAEAHIAARSGKGQGPLKIRAELRGKGVAGELIDAAMAQCQVDWQRLARQAAQKKLGGVPASSLDLQAKARLLRFMQQRGFTQEQVKALL